MLSLLCDNIEVVRSDDLQGAEIGVNCVAMRHCELLYFEVSRHTSLLSWGHFVESCRVVWSVALESVCRSNPSLDVLQNLVCGGANLVPASDYLSERNALSSLASPSLAYPLGILGSDHHYSYSPL